MVSSRTDGFIKEIFAKYYRELYELDAPADVESREFGFLNFNEQGMMRHISFGSGDELHDFLSESVPSNAYYSCAYYEQPNAEMDKKGWLGADLVFDIDADHIVTACNKVHDEWTCAGCGFSGRGSTPEKCPICGVQKFSGRTWICEDCLNSAKAETIKLFDILTQDLGLSKKEIRVFFSGNRGYHVHVASKDFKNADSVARKEVVDYVCGLGLNIAKYGLEEKYWQSRMALKGLTVSSLGWGGRLARSMRDFVLSAKQEEYRLLGIPGNIISALGRNRVAIANSFGGKGPLSVVKGVGLETWKKIAEHCVSQQSAKIDTVVTTDVHRLIRLPNTLHGKTGFKVVEVPVSAITDFDPFKSAIAFKKGGVSVCVSDSPAVRLGDETIGPYKNQQVELSTAAAVLLVCKGRAEVLEQNVQRAD
jgi:DNA primase small subunit